MERYDWRSVREILKQLQVRSDWISSSNLLAFASPNGAAVMRKTNNIRPEAMKRLLEQLDIPFDVFEQARKTYQTQ